MRQPQRRRQSSVSIARELGCSPDLVNRVRLALRLKPSLVEVADSLGRQRLMCVDRIGRKLTRAQHELIGQAAVLVAGLVRRKANGVLDEQELTGVAHEALIVAARCWRKDGGRTWEHYASQGICKSFRRAFYQRRRFLRTQRAILEHPAGADEDSLGGRLMELTGLPRLTGEWLSGYDGLKPRSRADLARFWNVPLAVIDDMIDDTRTALAG